MTAYRWHGDPALSEAARLAKPSAVDSDKELFRTRDVPRNCLCFWIWRGRPKRWIREATANGCPWHTETGREQRIQALVAMGVNRSLGRGHPGSITQAMAAQRLHVDRRTVQRDLAILREREMAS